MIDAIWDERVIKREYNRKWAHRPDGFAESFNLQRRPHLQHILGGTCTTERCSEAHIAMEGKGRQEGDWSHLFSFKDQYFVHEEREEERTVGG